MKTLPTISEYVAAMAAPEGRLRTLTHARAVLDAHGEAAFWVGNSAVVFLAEDSAASAGGALAYGDTRLALKCYTRWPLHAGAIYDYMAALQDPLLPRCRLLRGEIFVHYAAGAGAWHDVVASRWTEGITLQTALRRAPREGGFGELSAAFERLAVALLGREWAHGDLKPENIIVGCDGEMSLVDLDAMWIPSLAGCAGTEVGTPHYQHPARDEHYFCKSVDDFAVALIAVSLRALALDPALWERHHEGDNIILYPEQVVLSAAVGSLQSAAVADSAFDEVLRLFAEHGDYHSLRLAHALRTPTPAIEGLREMLLASSAEAVLAADIFEYPVRFSEGMAVVCAHGVWKIVGADGLVRASCAGWDYIKPFSEGIAAARRGEKWGYITFRGETLVEPIFDMAATMHEGRAVVGIRNMAPPDDAAAYHGGVAGVGNKYGFIDARGAIVVPLEWDYAGSFRAGRATVSRGNRDFPIDLNGKII